MGKALYRKYRSKSLDEIVGQKHITDTLKNAIKSGRISHAYLLTGPRGVGKTSVARILAHEINGIPYTDDSIHLDIIEIDAASNRRIDEIRELREKVYVAPTSAKYKVYIIDEVHMLTKEAFNALLKTLEEPPEHVVFILATTDAHKVPETIVSRTQRFTFKPVDKQAVIDHLATIAKQEKITVTPEALALIADHGQGSFRDSISLLDQARGIDATLDEQAVAHMLGLPESGLIQSLFGAIQAGDTVQTISALQALTEGGYQPASIASALSDCFRAELLVGKQLEARIVQLLHNLLLVPSAFQPDRFLEITLIQATNKPPTPDSITPASTIDPVNNAQPKAPKPEKLEHKVLPTTVASIPEMAVPEAPELTEVEIVAIAPSTDSRALDEDTWSQILAALKAQYNTLYGVIRMAQPSMEDDQLVLKFAFAFHQKRVSEAKNQRILADIISATLGKDVKIVCLVEKDAQPSVVEVKKPDIKSDKSPNISSISNIFGGAELIES